MTHQDYNAHVIEFTERMKSVTWAKNADYSAGTADAMHDYYAAAEECDVTPIKAWFVLFMKHVRAIQKFVRTGRVESEPMTGRFTDVANYAMLGDALVKDMAKRESIHDDASRP